MVTLAEFPLALTIWHQQGCPHCEEFLPRAERVSRDFPAVSVIAIDTARNERLADLLAVYDTPTVLLLRYGRTVQRWDRALTDDELTAALRSMTEPR